MKWSTTTLTRTAEWGTLPMELMGTSAVSELPDTSMTSAALRALLDILSINMTRGEAKALIAGSLMRVWRVATE